MSRILLVDDSPHAQRMGERILTDDGYEVVTVSNADSALIRLEDVDPDVVIADTVMPGSRTGYEICHYLRMSPRHRHVRVILTAGVLEPFNEAEVKRVAADGVLKKPFEATALLDAVQPLAEVAARIRSENRPAGAKGQDAAPARPAMPQPFVAVLDPEQVKAAVTVALDASMGAIVEEITARVLETLTAKRPETGGPGRIAAEGTAPPQPESSFLAAAQPAGAPELRDLEFAPEPAKTALPLPIPEAQRPHSDVTPVRRVAPLRRSGSILGLDIGVPGPGFDPPFREPGAK